ncbi:hypothetical protein INR77_01310 [Erythrobacter sp. SCSIO 43205]|uniref:PAS domain-containing protein n=1 Tax=Erythrobacter sp. SCSIO 43205 TaxID=2779361 RepID=UPI001CA8AAD5|nr:hypothetical protein [Erythrobacter sp. SCSIO 43205]UAB78412.1 hypothetical protein INR77_01310 [Erythrobacter sp. SCSIO 43205]
MDTLRGPFDSGLGAEDTPVWDVDDRLDDSPDDEQVSGDLPPASIGQDERRMQVRAYNHWASLLGENTFPSIEELSPEDLDDFGPNSVLLDFSHGIEDPAVQFLGAKLAEECDANGEAIQKLSDVPPRSLLSRITDHYMQILANQAPIGFEAEFVNERGASVLYRGILLPFSSNDETIDFIYGVINWKEMADAATADELLLAIDQAIDDKLASGDAQESNEPQKHNTGPVTEWADSPLHDEEIENEPLAANDAQHWEDEIEDEIEKEGDDNIASFSDALNSSTPDDDLPTPEFGARFDEFELDEPEVDEFGEEIDEDEDYTPSYSFASLADYIEAPSKKAVDLDADRFDPDDYKVEEPVKSDKSTAAPAQFDEPASDTQELVFESENGPTLAPIAFDPEATLHDCLASARELAQNAAASEDRSRQALYAAVGRAYDVSLAAKDEPEAFEELIADSGLTVQERAPMTPVVKLVFGHDYDKTRLTEYAAVLTHAHRLGLERGSLASFLAEAEGGLKAVVASERRLRREEAGETVENEGDVRAKLAKKLRELEAMMFDTLSAEGPEFSLVMVRRDGEGNVAMIGEITDDVALIERAGKKLVG